MPVNGIGVQEMRDLLEVSWRASGGSSGNSVALGRRRCFGCGIASWNECSGRASGRRGA
jgi:hypothetical protein